MKSQRGITLTSLVIYITIVLIVVGILALITTSLQGNIKDIYAEGINNGEIDKFNVYFLKEVKKQGNAINTLSENEVVFKTGNKYTFNSDDKCIYLNDNIKIAENIEKCEFSKPQENENVIEVKIQAINGEEKSINYVLSNNELSINLEEENNYINYIPDNWKVEKLNSGNPVVIEIVDNAEVDLAPIPKGFEVSTKTGENTISGGLVITDEDGNEFVWVPVPNAETYTEDIFGPLTGVDVNNKVYNYVYDSYQTMQYYYGNALGEINNQTSFDAIFTYEEDKENVERSIRTYGGFYVGRYETTYDSLLNGVAQGIGVKRNRFVLKTDSLLRPETETKPASNELYYYRWWGVYKAQKDMYATNDYVGSLMITSKQWDTVMDYTKYGDAKRLRNTYTNLNENGLANAPDKSGTAYSTDSNQYDEAKNIYDLAGNLEEWTLTRYAADKRIPRGGYYGNDNFVAKQFNYTWPYYGTANWRF